MNKEGMLTKQEMEKLIQIGINFKKAMEDYQAKRYPYMESDDWLEKRIKHVKEDSSICTLCGRLGAFHNFQWMPWGNDKGRQEFRRFCNRKILDRRLERVLTPDYAKTEYAQAFMILKTGVNLTEKV
jgi:hypothetical protein